MRWAPELPGMLVTEVGWELSFPDTWSKGVILFFRSFIAHNSYWSNIYYFVYMTMDDMACKFNFVRKFAKREKNSRDRMRNKE